MAIIGKLGHLRRALPFRQGPIPVPGLAKSVAGLALRSGRMPRAFCARLMVRQAIPASFASDSISFASRSPFARNVRKKSSASPLTGLSPFPATACKISSALRVIASLPHSILEARMPFSSSCCSIRNERPSPFAARLFLTGMKSRRAGSSNSGSAVTTKAARAAQ